MLLLDTAVTVINSNSKDKTSKLMFILDTAAHLEAGHMKVKTKTK